MPWSSSGFFSQLSNSGDELSDTVRNREVILQCHITVNYVIIFHKQQGIHVFVVSRHGHVLIYSLMLYALVNDS